MKKGTVSLGSPGGSSFTSSVSDDFNLSADFNSMPSFTTSADFLTSSSKPVENGQNGNGKSAKEKGDEKQSKKQIEADHSLTNADDIMLIEDLRLRISSELKNGDDIPPTYILFRWLKAAQFNVETAASMFIKSQEWRKLKGVDHIINWSPPEVLRKFYPGGLSGYDKDGCPVWIVPLGSADLKGLLTSVSKQDFIDYTIRLLEVSLVLMKEKTRQLGSPVYQHTFIFDMDGFSFRDATYAPTIEVVQALIAVYEENYPETLKAAYVINTSKLFQIVFNIIQATVNQRTLQKIKVFGLHNWKQVLLEQIESQNLPEKWGGTKELGQLSNEPHTGDICMGGEVPLYYKSTAKSIDDVKGLNSIYKQSIVAGSTFTLKYPVRVQSNLIWKFRIEGGEIEFGIQRRRVRVEESSGSNSSLNSEEPKVPALAVNETQSFKKKKPSILTNSEKDVIGALDQPSVNMDEKETSTTSPLKEQDESRHNQLLESTRYQDTITEHLTSELVLMKEESDALKQLEESTEEKINLFDETDEDVNIPLENVFQKVKVLSKDSQGGCLACDPGYVYTLTFDNSESMFRSRKLFYTVNLEDTLKKKEDTAIVETGEQISMGMTDLMNFVKDLVEMEDKKKNDLFQPLTPKNTAV